MYKSDICGEFVYTYGLTLYKAIEILPICYSEGIEATVIFTKNCRFVSIK